MEEDLYDEFGNYIGPELPDPRRDQPEDDDEAEGEPEDQLPQDGPNPIVLHEDKVYYPSHQQLYPGAQILYQQQDHQALQTPILPTGITRLLDLLEPLDTQYDSRFAKELSLHQDLARNVLVAGALHHGKTNLIDLLVRSVHAKEWPEGQLLRWTDSGKDQQERCISLRLNTVSLVLQQAKTHKSRLVTVLDSPGHPDFLCEVEAGARLADGVLLVVDAVQGLLAGAKRIIQAVSRQGLKVLLVISKIDRLITELRLPPQDAYLKIRLAIYEVNKQLQLHGSQQRVCPTDGSVFFLSSRFNLAFNLESVDQLYLKLKRAKLGSYLWGDYAFNPDTRKFAKFQPGQRGSKRTFVEFVLQPIYKVFSHLLTKERQEAQPLLASLGVRLPVQVYKQPAQTVLRAALKDFLFSLEHLVHAMVNLFPSSQRNSQEKMAKYSAHVQEGAGLPQQAVVVDVVRMVHSENRLFHRALGRVLKGTVKTGMAVSVLPSSQDNQHEEDVFEGTVSSISLGLGRSLLAVGEAKEGCIVYLQGVDQFIPKRATLLHPPTLRSPRLSYPRSLSSSVVRVAVEPHSSGDMGKLLLNLRKVNKEYGQLQVKVQQTGEQAILGTGELMLDCAFHDLRHLFEQIQIRISDPSVIFSETVKRASGAFGIATSANQRNRINLLAKPVSKPLFARLESPILPLPQPAELQEQFGWDIQLASSVMSFGPGPNVLVDGTLIDQVNRVAMGEVRGSLVQGYRWAAKEGPLCDQPMRGVQFDIARIMIGNRAESGPGQMIPMVRRACFSSFLLASPRIMEPLNAFQLHCTAECLPTVNKLLHKRRGFTSKEVQLPATPQILLYGGIPTIESFGFQTDLRVMTSGLGFVTSWFDSWNELEGDPLDEGVVLRVLQPAQLLELPRQIMVKTRRRKGLGQTLSLSKYFDEGLYPRL